MRPKWVPHFAFDIPSIVGMPCVLGSQTRLATYNWIEPARLRSSKTLCRYRVFQTFMPGGTLQYEAKGISSLCRKLFQFNVSSSLFIMSFCPTYAGFWTALQSIWAEMRCNRATAALYCTNISLRFCLVLQVVPVSPSDSPSPLLLCGGQCWRRWYVSFPSDWGLLYSSEVTG